MRTRTGTRRSYRELVRRLRPHYPPPIRRHPVYSCRDHDESTPPAGARGGSSRRRDAPASRRGVPAAVAARSAGRARCSSSWSWWSASPWRSSRVPLLSAKHEAKAAQSDLTPAKDALSSHHDRRRPARYIKQARAHVDQAPAATPTGSAATCGRSLPVAGGAVDDARHLVDALDQTTSVAELGVADLPDRLRASQPRWSAASGSTCTLLQKVVDRTVRDRPAPRPGDERPGPGPGHHADRRRVDRRAAKATALGYLTPLQDTYADQRAAAPGRCPGLVGADGPRTYLLAMLNPAEQRYSGGGALSFTTMRFDHGAGDVRQERERRRHPGRSGDHAELDAGQRATRSTRQPRCASPRRPSRRGGRCPARSCCAATGRPSPASASTA